MNVTDEIGEHFRLVGTQKKALESLGLSTIKDLLLHIPQKYEDVGNAVSIEQLLSGGGAGEMVTVYGELLSLEKKLMWKTKKYAVEAWLEDATGRIKVRWFNQPYMADSLKFVKYVKITSKLTGTGKTAYFASPLIEQMPGLPDSSELMGGTTQSGLYPIYKTSYGITSRWFYYAMRRVLDEADLRYLPEEVPSEIIAKYNLPTLASALVWAHMPESTADADAARKRFAFDEVFYLQVAAALARSERNTAAHYKIEAETNGLNGTLSKFIQSFPFELTNAQRNAVDTIVSDMASGNPMARLLEGDVGSGKTAVASAVSFAVVANKLQVAYMAPTEVLAKQLFESFVGYFKNTNVQVGLLTGRDCKKYPSKTNPDEATKISKAQLLKWVEDGSIGIVIGTHALIQKNVTFKQLGLAIIDEQHRFGTKQRAGLLKNNADNKIPHLLSMTATPIPRTLALTIYGDLDLTIIDEMPRGRKKVITKVVGKNKMEDVYAHMRTEIAAGRQAYVICPRIAHNDIEESGGGAPSMQKLMMARLKSVEDEVKNLRKVFPSLEIDALHGKLTPADKEEIMAEFANHTIHILVATSVVEVGVNVPNATMIVIEGAERFGLSQLHQLRGRVIRSAHQAYCYLTTTNKTVAEATKERLKALVTAKNGFELAEMDLTLRGAGELRGDSQWGTSDIAMEAIKNIKMVEAARNEAQALVAKSTDLKLYPELMQKIQMSQKIHLE
jgi:ATP-dependent DNA helicase RecG